MTEHFSNNGGQNDVFTTDPNQNSVTSGTAIVAAVTAGAANAYPAETITITFLDPDTGVVTAQTANLIANATAQEHATVLSAISRATFST